VHGRTTISVSVSVTVGVGVGVDVDIEIIIIVILIVIVIVVTGGLVSTASINMNLMVVLEKCNRSCFDMALI
jgi:hypothetical protein